MIFATPLGPGVSIEHTDSGDDAEMQDGVSSGWPMVLSGLKTLLESGLRDNMKMPDDASSGRRRCSVGSPQDPGINWRR